MIKERVPYGTEDAAHNPADVAGFLHTFLSENASLAVLLFSGDGLVKGARHVANVCPSHVFRPAVDRNAAGIVLGRLAAGPECDVERLAAAGRCLGIVVLDCIVLSPDGYVSFRERGWIE